MKSVGIYIHIPFCKQKCYYCDFISFANKKELVEKYVNALKKEIVYKLKNIKEYEITTIYIGGGTPSYLDSKYIKDILEQLKKCKVNISNNVEITIEVNPGTVTEQKVMDYKSIGINRLSIGLQVSQNGLLKQIGRIHTYEDFINTYRIIKKIGIQNINIDLMIGLPNQNLKDIKNSLNEVIELNPNHISVYSLIVEEGTILENKISKGEFILPNENLERKMYWLVKKELEKSGYKHYEISNFSKQGFESQHNLNCWKQEEYLGFGLASHSYINNKRFSNIENLDLYIDSINNEDFEKNMIINEIQTIETKKREYMLLGLRTIQGVLISNYKNKFCENPLYVFRKEFDKLVNLKLVRN